MTELKSPTVALPTTVRVPQHVVYRDFVAETVVLNLNTGVYHGLNPTAGRMLKLLDELGDVGLVVARLASEYRRPRSEIAADLEIFCRDLLERDLIVELAARRLTPRGSTRRRRWHGSRLAPLIAVSFDPGGRIDAHRSSPAALEPGAADSRPGMRSGLHARCRQRPPRADRCAARSRVSCSTPRS